MKCNKCNGTGYIDGFMHVRSGICFQCNGSGNLVEHKKATVTYSRAFIFQFYQSSFFPEDQSAMQKVVCISSEGHPTAEKWVMKDEEFYYIGQPVCRASMWYKIPLDQFRDFIKHYNKAFKTQIAYDLELH